MRAILISFITLSILALSACGGSNTKKRHVERYENLPVVKENDGIIRNSKFTSNSNSAIRSALYSHYREWKRVRYKLGGMSKRGIDCSRFVHLAYREKFGIKLPLNTYEQHGYGRRIEKKQLRPGDLVFFRTDFYGNHVGIYLKGGKFMHASVSQGVTISYLDEDYWTDRYWKSKRIIGR